MASETTDIMSTDVYLATQFVNKLKEKYIDIPEETLYLGIYGYLTSVFSNLIENTAIMASEYSTEAIPTRAKFERNVIAHALSLGINKITANPAEMDVMLAFPESLLVANMTNNKITIDKDYDFNVGNRKFYPYHLDYDIIIRRFQLPNGKYAYTAVYDLDGKNPLSSIYTPYLPAMGTVNVDGDRLISLQTTLRQMTHTQIYKNITVSNPLETKVLSFEFDDQLAYFYVEVTETVDGVDQYHYLEPVYDGLYDYDSTQEYINYMYLDESTIRLVFNRNSYQPRSNAKVVIHVFTTLGAKCNYTLKDYQMMGTMASNRFSYNGLYYVLMSESDSQYGSDKFSVEKLQQYIPKEYTARGSISTYTDLSNFFNIIQTEDCHLRMLRKVHNQTERLYYCYLLMRENGNIIPTNTINATFDRNIFNTITRDCFIIYPGSIYYQELTDSTATGLYSISSTDIDKYDSEGFLYMCPYLIMIKKSPFYVSYYNVFINYQRELLFEFINDTSELQFIALKFKAYRYYYTKKNEVHVSLKLTQNINTDYDLISYDLDGNIETCKVSVFMVLYSPDPKDDTKYIPYRYVAGKIQQYKNGEYDFDFSMTTDNSISPNKTYMHFTKGLKAIGTSAESAGYLSKTMPVKFFIFAEMDAEYGRMYGDMMTDNSDDLFPNMGGYTLTNIYAPKNGLDIFYDYTDLMNSFIDMKKDETGFFQYTTYKIPVVRYTYLRDEDRIINFFKMVDYRRRFIQEALVLLEDSFGIDYKLFNTYGPALTYNIENRTNIDKINLTLKFEIRFVTKEDQNMLPQIKASIKDYIEDMNNITDLHMPNLITYITNLYRENIVYIKFVKLNSYDSLYQSIYKNPKLANDYFVETQTVPEFINVNTLNNDEPDIEFDIKEVQEI